MSELRTIIVTGASSGHRRLLRAGAEGATAGACSPPRASRRTSRRSRPTASRPSISTIASRNRSRRWSTAVLERTGGTLDALFNNGALCPARRRRGSAGRGAARAVRGQFLRLARSDAPRRAGDARAGPRPHRPLLVDPRPGAGQVARRLCRLQARAGRADAVPADRSSQGSGIHVSLIEPGPVESKIAPNALAWFLKQHRPRELGASRGLSGAARAHARRRQRSRG